jgi:hypothetical protein
LGGDLEAEDPLLRQSLAEMEKNNISFTELARRAIKQVRNNYAYTSTICYLVFFTNYLPIFGGPLWSQ